MSRSGFRSLFGLKFHKNHFGGAHFGFGDPVHKAEIYLDVDVEMANKIVQNGASSEMDQFACSILRETITLAIE